MVIFIPTNVKTRLTINYNPLILACIELNILFSETYIMLHYSSFSRKTLNKYITYKFFKPLTRSFFGLI